MSVAEKGAVNRMRRVLKWVGIGLGGIVALLGIALIVVYFLSERELGKTVQVSARTIEIPTGAESVDRGEYLAEAVAVCTECHGDDLGGQYEVDDPLLGKVAASNLTSGKGGIGSTFSDQDFIKAVRHGVGRDGRRLLIMPSLAFSSLDAEDLGDILAYVKSAPPVDRELEGGLGILGRVLLVTGGLPPFAADLIDHDAERSSAPARDADEEYGEYLATVGGCTDCHREDLSGGPIAGAPPGTPAAANLTRDALGDWSEEDFVRALRTGFTPTGKQINDFMPWRHYANMTDQDLSALWAYLESLEE